jgi:hypothetical protein
MDNLSVGLIYLIEGTIIIPLNFILALSIIVNRSLRERKELVFIAGLAVADTMYGVGVFDIGRDMLMNLVMTNNSLYPATPIHCFCRVRELFISYPSQVSLIIMIAISAERLIAIVWYQQYAHIRYVSHIFVLIFAFLFPISTMSVAGVLAFIATQSQIMVTGACVNYSPVFTLFLPFFKIVLGITSVVIYSIVLFAFFKVSPITTSRGNSDVQATRRRRLTQTLAIISGCTLVFYCIPWISVLILNNVFRNFVLNGPVWLFLPIQYIMNVLVFYWRQKDIRQSIKALLCLKTKPTNSSSVNIVPSSRGQ